jgi:hypothetical protein
MAEFKLGRIRYTWRGEWSSGTTYYKDDVVAYGAKTYVCLDGHTAESGGGFYNDLTAVETNTVPPAPAPRWEQMADGYTWTGEWQSNLPYNINDLVKYGGTVYKCLTPHTSSSLPGVGISYQSTHGLENDQVKWEIYARTEDWKNIWQTDTPYRAGDIVKYGAYVYRCITAHTSAGSVNLGLENNIASWEIVHIGIEYLGNFNPTGRYKLNDVVKYGSAAYICTTSHISSGNFNDANWAVYAPGLEYEQTWDSGTSYQIGDIVKYGGYSYFALTFNLNSIPSTNPSDWELLSIGYNWLGEYNPVTNYQIGDIVRRAGTTFACIQPSLANDPTNTTYWEIVNEGTRWRAGWADATQYEINDIVTFTATAYICLQRHTSATITRPDKITAASYWILLSLANESNRLREIGDINTYGEDPETLAITDTRLPIGTEGAVLQNVDNLATWELFSNIVDVYYVSVEGTDSVSRGTTIDTPWRTVKYACENISGPATIFIKTGYYEEILPIRIPADVALVGDELRGTTITPATGYEQEDMFYVSNGSGVRNMTLSGLTGVLGGLNQYLTARPTAGAYVSLDPGTGTTDSSVWISSRSPYVQNVTTFGTGCVGLKVDGNLHDGGNRSIVANDFTQVLSDGIGAWVTNGGLSELVSVFSYYGHIGYLAENGGKIRATNGNSSYGTYGCVAEGVLLAETPITGKINNQSGEATVDAAVSGNIGDQILILEYSHCGENYTNAVFNFTGAGVGAAVTPEYRDGAVYEVRIIGAGDSSTIGGANYKLSSNNAQTGDNLTITLASSDPNTTAQFIGMRIFISSGTGTGQYGYIQAYDDVTKIATVYKESDDSPGWDHVAGFSIEAVLDSSTTYIVEPRVIFSAPDTGTRARGRVKIVSNRIAMVKIWDCGSGYTSPPTVTIVDPNNTVDAVLEARIGDGVLGPVIWNNRGTSYQTVSTRVSISGDGFADQFQLGASINLKEVSIIPGPGDNLTITGINDVVYKVVKINSVTGLLGNYNINIDIFPILETEESPQHETIITIRQKYSQVRLTGHDFLDIGTGNFQQTRYPDLYQDFNFTASPENEVVEVGGGRVFYTSTDQDGNFRVGELFKVEQATGTVTISASLFALSGLEELSLGGVSIGGTGTVIREFSTDSTFLADSNNIVPTQKAIKSYITARISGGGSDVFTTILTAGQVIIGPNLISSTVSGGTVNFDAKATFNGGIDGTALALAFYSHSFDSGLDFQDVVNDLPS